VRARLAAALALALAAGCSSLEFAYNNAGTWLRWQGERYLDLDEAQSEDYAQRVETFLAWHRAQALPQYANLATEAEVRLSRGLIREDMVWGYDAMRSELRVSLRRAGAALAGLMGELRPAQIEHLERRFAELDRRFARERLAGTSAERRQRRGERLMHELEDWVGELSAAQRERIREFSERAPLTGEQRLAERRRRQAELIDRLRAGEAARGFADWAAEWDRGRDPAFAEASRAVTDEFFALLADLDRGLSTAQRAYAAARLRAYARDFQALAAGR
jgi:hypothetical protein